MMAEPPVRSVKSYYRKQSDENNYDYDDEVENLVNHFCADVTRWFIDYIYAHTEDLTLPGFPEMNLV